MGLNSYRAPTKQDVAYHLAQTLRFTVVAGFILALAYFLRR
jgi:hypothetical protein